MEITPYQGPNIMGNIIQLLEQKRLSQAGEADKIAAQAKVMEAELKKKKEAADFALNMLSGVQSQDDLKIAKNILRARYPGDPEINMIPDTYDPKTIRMLSDSLMDAKTRLDREKFNWEKTGKITTASAGSALVQGGKVVGNVPPTPQKNDYDVFEGPNGDQVYVTKGGDIPNGYKKVVGKGSTNTTIVNTGELTKASKTKVEQSIMDAEKNIASFGQTKALFKPEYLTYIGKGEKEIASIMGKAGVASEDQKKFVSERAKWFRQAKADFIAYRKWATGVAGGEKELEEIATAFPDPVKNSPEEYIANLESINETTQRVLELDRDYLQSGIKLGGKSSSPPVTPSASITPTSERVIQFDKNGKRITQ